MVFFDFDFESYSFYNLVWVDNLITNKYNLIEYIIKFILIMEELIKLPDNKSNNILKIFQKSYGWDDNKINIKNVKSKYYEYKKQLKK